MYIKNMLSLLTLGILANLCLIPVIAERRKFPDGFKFGVSSSAYQIEGGWNADDKCESIWDHFVHKQNKTVLDGSNGDVACDSYKLFKKDVEMLRDLGVDSYRFSISWCRVLPEGMSAVVSKAGVAYYNALIDELINKNITPHVSMLHFDHPQKLQDLGGWTNSLTVDYFADYADVLYQNFGDRVKNWITINEANIFCLTGYGLPVYAPGVNYPGVSEYLCNHNLLKAHAAAYRLYEQKYRSKQKGRVSLALNAFWFVPIDENEPTDVEAAERGMLFNLDTFADPVFSDSGDYPQSIKDIVGRKSAEQGYPRSRLPKFTREEIEDIKGTFDTFGLNHYSTMFVRTPKRYHNSTQPASFYGDMGLEDANGSYISSSFQDIPWGFTKVLKYIKQRYDNPEIEIYENGKDTHGADDIERIVYLNKYMNALLDGIESGSNVTMYSVWSLMDSFEWYDGYTKSYGLYSVNFTDPLRTRTVKASAKYYNEIIRTRSIERTVDEIDFTKYKPDP